MKKPVVVKFGSSLVVDARGRLRRSLLRGRADVVVAVDVFGVPAAERGDMPGAWECVSTTLLVMANAIVAAKLNHAAPDLLIRPNVASFRTLDFYQASAVLRASEAVKAEVKEKLGALLAG